ncbi:MAG: rhamnulokinase [Pirellulaceae bacterium]|jgi:rhamnulokinase
MSEKVFLAVDLGASSGRVVGGLFDGKTLQLEDVHRFSNGGIIANDRMYWDVLALWSNIVEGLRKANGMFGDKIVSVGVDTWGVDFALLGRDDELLGNPFNYRDSHTQGILDKAFNIVSREDIFADTGLQFMEFNSLFQLLAMKQANSPILENAESFLMIPDLFHWLLTGVKANEFTNTTTSQLYNPQSKQWATSLMEKFGLPTKILNELRQPGDCLGPLRESVAKATGLSNVNVVLPGTHDTASAVMAVPAASQAGAAPDWCYISSGTWSLMGIETPSPIISAKCAELNFTNEGGVGDTVRVLKNIAGLWLVQECRRIWNQEGNDFDFGDLVTAAESSSPLVSFINPDAFNFVAPVSMPQAIQEYCQASGQSVPETPGQVIRCALESLALRYRSVLNWLEELSGAAIGTIHIVGGGTQNKLLCQMAADACNRPVVAGPVEATAIGNVMMQAVSAGEVESIAAAREVIKFSFDVERYEPRETEQWDEAFGKFQGLGE